MRKLAAMTAVAALSLAMGSPALAFVQTWEILDHPDGNQNPPAYGLRIDNLFNWDDFSWSFDSLADMTLTYYDATEVGGERIEIRGTATGGRYHSPDFADMLDANGERVWSDKGTWSFDLTYDATSAADMLADFDGDPATVELRVDDVVNLLGSSTTPGVNGRVELIGDLMSFDDVNNVYVAGSSFLQVGDFVELESKGKGPDGISDNHFFLSKDRHRLGPNQGIVMGGSGNTEAECLGAGHTLEMCNRWTGAGWVTVTSSLIGGYADMHKSSGTRDLLFTARLEESQQVPAPATFGLLGVGLAGLGALRRRRAAAG